MIAKGKRILRTTRGRILQVLRSTQSVKKKEKEIIFEESLSIKNFPNGFDHEMGNKCLSNYITVSQVVSTVGKQLNQQACSANSDYQRSKKAPAELKEEYPDMNPPKYKGNKAMKHQTDGKFWKRTKK